MICLTRFRTRSNRFHAFSALEALVMLLALFILTMLGIGLWKKKGKEEKIEMPAPANTIGLIKSNSPEVDENSPTEKPQAPTTPGKPAPTVVDQAPPIKKPPSKESTD